MNAEVAKALKKLEHEAVPYDRGGLDLDPDTREAFDIVCAALKIADQEAEAWKVLVEYATNNGVGVLSCRSTP